MSDVQHSETVAERSPTQASTSKAYFSDRPIIIACYALIFAVSYWLAFAFRFDFDFDQPGFRTCYQSIMWVVLFKTAVFYVHRHFHGCWFYATIKDVQVLTKSALVCSIFVLLFGRNCFPPPFPRTAPITDCILTIFLVGSLRLGWRVLRQDILPRITKQDYRKVLLIGANHEGAALAHELGSYPKLGYRIVGFLSLHGEKVGKQLGHIPVIGHVAELETIITTYGIREVLTISGILRGDVIRNVMNTCRKKGVLLRIVPSMDNRLGGASVPMRDINIEDLLKREPIKLDDSKIEELIRERRILVTGAGGSIGSEICRQILRYEPKTLILLGRGENRIFYLERELQQTGFVGELVAVIADVTREQRLEQIFRQYRPEVVFHAAAHKHVPLMEANVPEAIVNNVIGTKTVADLADRYDVAAFVLVSTDKAVNPTNVMGASKHLAERYIHSLSSSSKTKFIVTRFGNVLGSAGSVVPIFKEQIASGGPVTVTDHRMTRFFMTIPEASQLVLQAAAMGRGGEIYVLDMGEPVKIIDLAKDMIRLGGLPEEAVEIHEVGIRPGEKLYEELYFDSEKTVATAHPKLRGALHRPCEMQVVEKQIAELVIAAATGQPSKIKEKLKECVAEYQYDPALEPVRFPEPPLSVFPKENESIEWKKTA